MLPGVEAVLARWLLGELVGLHPRRGGLGGAVAADQVDVLLLQPLLRALVVVEHRRVEVELDDLAHLAERSLGVPDEVFEVDLVVVRDSSTPCAALSIRSTQSCADSS